MLNIFIYLCAWHIISHEGILGYGNLVGGVIGVRALERYFSVYAGTCT